MNKFNNKRKDENFEPDEEEIKLLNRINERLRASLEKRDSLGMPSIWAQNQKYWAGEVNLPVKDDDIGSETNIVQPIIESQVAELVDGQTDILVKGVGPSDQPFSQDVQHILNFVWRKNRMVVKFDEAERDRLNLGSITWKVYQDPDALNGRGLPTIEPVAIDLFLPDARINNPRELQKGDYCIELLPMTTRNLRKQFGNRAKLVKTNGLTMSNEARVFNTEESSNPVMMDQVMVILYWEKDDDDKLRRVYCTEDVILADSFDDKNKDGESESFYRHGKYPYVTIPCYIRKGNYWGMSDTEQLIPIQDLINDLDDQIVSNARITGNNQVVVATSSGININKWTNKEGLKIPSKDVNGFRQVIPYPIPSYIPNRRDRAFQESEIVSGRSDIVEGRRSGSLRAASAILAMQEAGSRRNNHKKLMNQEGFNEILGLVLDYVKEFMTEEQAFDITEKGNTEYLWFRGSDLTHIPWKSLNENFDPTSDEPGTELYKDLYDDIEEIDEFGNPVTRSELMTKDAEFDIEVSLGAGMPNNKSFLYQATIELMRENIITQEEARACLKQLLNWPIIDPFNPVGKFSGRNSSDEQLDIANGMTPGMVGGVEGEQVEPPTQASVAPPANDQAQYVIQQALAQLPPEVARQLIMMLEGVRA